MMHRSTFCCLALLFSTFGCTLGATLPPNRALKQRQVSASPVLILTRPTDLTTCTTAVLQWVYTGPDLTMTLEITNVGVTQTVPPPASLPPRANSAPNDGRDVEGLVPGAALTPLPPAGEHVRDLHAVAPRSEVPLSKRASFPVTVTYPSDGTFLFTTDKNFRVATVQLPEGWYVLTAAVLLEDGSPGGVPTFYRPVATGPFFVRNGTDTSCVITENGPPTPSQSDSSSSDSETASSTSNSESTTESETGSPGIIGAASSKPVNSGAIAGGVVGGLAFLALIIAGFLYIRLLQSKSSGKPKAAGGGVIRKRGGKDRKWGGLGSVDSVLAPGRGESNTAIDAAPEMVRPERRPSGASTKHRTAHKHQSTASSLGTMLAQPSLSYQYNPYADFSGPPQDGLSSSPSSVSPTPARSFSQSSPSRGQVPTYPDPFFGELRLQTATPLPASTERRPSASASTTHETSRPGTSVSYFTDLGDSTIHDVGEESRSRSASNGRKRGSMEVPAQGHTYQMSTRLARENSGRAAPIKTTYPPSTSPTTTSPVSRGRRASSTQNPSPITPSTSTGPELTLGNGQGSSGQGRKKASRKPVPTYDATELQASHSSGPTPASTPPSSVPNTSPLAARLQRERDSMKRQFSASVNNLHGSQIDLTMAAQNLDDPPELQALRHKNSFGIGLPGAGDGGRQVHYLIPDMPPPNRE